MQGELRNSFGVSLWEKLHSIMQSVVNFDLHLGAAHSNSWSKSDFSLFLCKKAEKRKKSQIIDAKFGKKKFFLVCMQTNTSERLVLFFFISILVTISILLSLPCYHRSLRGNTSDWQRYSG